MGCSIDRMMVKDYQAICPISALLLSGIVSLIAMPEPKRPWKFQPWGGVAVVADNTWAAMRGRAALEIEWAPGDNAGKERAPEAERLRHVRNRRMV